MYRGDWRKTLLTFKRKIILFLTCPSCELKSSTKFLQSHHQIQSSYEVVSFLDDIFSIIRDPGILQIENGTELNLGTSQSLLFMKTYFILVKLDLLTVGLIIKILDSNMWLNNIDG